MEADQTLKKNLNNEFLVLMLCVAGIFPQEGLGMRTRAMKECGKNDVSNQENFPHYTLYVRNITDTQKGTFLSQELEFSLYHLGVTG